MAGSPSSVVIEWTGWEGRQWQSDGCTAVRRDVWPAPLSRARPAELSHEAFRGVLASFGLDRSGSSAWPVVPDRTDLVVPSPSLVGAHPDAGWTIAEQVAILAACAGTSVHACPASPLVVTAGWDAIGELCAIVAHWPAGYTKTHLPPDWALPMWLVLADSLQDPEGRAVIRRIGLQWEWLWPYDSLQFRESHRTAEEAIEAAAAWRAVYLS